MGGSQELEKGGSGFSLSVQEGTCVVLTPGFQPGEAYFKLLTSRIAR